MLLERLRTFLKVGFNGQYDAVLVQLGKDRGNLTLAKGVIEGVIDHLWRNTQP